MHVLLLGGWVVLYCVIKVIKNKVYLIPREINIYILL